MADPADKTDAVKLLYGIAISDIREFKARQWDITKWAITVILALIIPRVLAADSVSSRIVEYLPWAGLAFGIWAIVVILRLQWSLRRSRRNLENYKDEWPSLRSGYGEPKAHHTSFFRDLDIWLFQIALIGAATVTLLLATCSAKGSPYG